MWYLVDIPKRHITQKIPKLRYDAHMTHRISQRHLNLHWYLFDKQHEDTYTILYLCDAHMTHHKIQSYLYLYQYLFETQHEDTWTFFIPVWHITFAFVGKYWGCQVEMWSGKLYSPMMRMVVNVGDLLYHSRSFWKRVSTREMPRNFEPPISTTNQLLINLSMSTST